MRRLTDRLYCAVRRATEEGREIACRIALSDDSGLGDCALTALDEQGAHIRYVWNGETRQRIVSLDRLYVSDAEAIALDAIRADIVFRLRMETPVWNWASGKHLTGRGGGWWRGGRCGEERAHVRALRAAARGQR